MTLKRPSAGILGVLVLIAVLIAGGVMAQLQQSGGPGSAVTATQAGTWTMQPGNTANTTAWKVDGSAVTQPVSGTVNVIPKTACGNALATGSILAAIPTSSTLLTSAATACVTRVLFNNGNAGAGTVTLTDNTATPINAVVTFSLPGLSNMVLPLDGIGFNLGVKWSASGTGFTGAVLAYQ